MGVEKLHFPHNSEKLGDRKCLGKRRKSFVRHPDAILFREFHGTEFFNSHSPLHQRSSERQTAFNHPASRRRIASAIAPAMVAIPSVCYSPFLGLWWNCISGAKLLPMSDFKFGGDHYSHCVCPICKGLGSDHYSYCVCPICKKLGGDHYDYCVCPICKKLGGKHSNHCACPVCHRIG